MKRMSLILALVAALVLAAGSFGGPGTKQNGSNPLFTDFTSICAVPGYLFYGMCNGSATTFTNVTGRINAMQPKPGIWNLGFSFGHLTPGAQYRLWGNQLGATPVAGDISGFFIIGTGTADSSGNLKFSYQTTNPTNLGFDLNFLPLPDTYNGTTIVTSYWSQQWVEVLNADGTLYITH
jgi:hypothetical protein